MWDLELWCFSWIVRCSRARSKQLASNRSDGQFSEAGGNRTSKTSSKHGRSKAADLFAAALLASAALLTIAIAMAAYVLAGKLAFALLYE